MCVGVMAPASGLLHLEIVSSIRSLVLTCVALNLSCRVHCSPSYIKLIVGKWVLACLSRRYTKLILKSLDILPHCQVLVQFVQLRVVYSSPWHILFCSAGNVYRSESRYRMLDLCAI